MVPAVDSGWDLKLTRLILGARHDDREDRDENMIYE